MNELAPTPSVNSSDERWKFLRDVAVFQLKMLFDNLRDFALVPVSLGAAVFDLIFKGEREGALFYRVLQWGAHSERVINVYSAIESHESPDLRIHPNYTVDGVISRLESVLVREYEKGGTAASIKDAMDRAMTQLHNETTATREKATDLVTRAAGKVREKFETNSPKDEPPR